MPTRRARRNANSLRSTCLCQLRVTISRTHTVIIFLDIITTGTWEKPCDFRSQIVTFEASNIAAHAAAVVIAVAASQAAPPLHPSQHEYKVWFGPDAGTVIDFNADVIKLAFNTGAEQANASRLVRARAAEPARLLPARTHTGSTNAWSASPSRATSGGR